MKKQLLLILALLCLVLSGCTENNQSSDFSSKSSENSEITSVSSDNTDKNSSTAVSSGITNDDSEYLKTFSAYLKSDAGWSELFIKNLDLSTLYNNYLNENGKNEDNKAFSDYLLKNLKVSSNWKDLFEQDLYNAYQVKPEKYEDIGDNNYTVYAKDADGKVVPFVTVNAITGYFHG